LPPSYHHASLAGGDTNKRPRRLAEAGCTPHQIQAITGHQNLKEIETYTKTVEQKMLANAAIASVTKAFHHPEVANPDDGLADIDFNA
jgi:hypothetical protein